MKKKAWMLEVAAILAIALTAGTEATRAQGSATKPASAAVSIDNFSFGPATITISAGSTVTWTNHDDVPHVVTKDDTKLFKSKPLDTGDRFSFTFTKPGTYDYYCAIHPKMTGKIVVR